MATKVLDQNGLLFFWAHLKLLLHDKVDAETGKGIIDLAEYQNLKNTVESLQTGTYDDTEIRGMIADVADDVEALQQAVDGLAIPAKVSDLANDSGYQTAADVDTKIGAALTSAVTYKGTVEGWDDLPGDAAVGDMYNVQNASEHNRAGDNVVWSGTEWDVQAGIIDLSQFLTADDVLTNDEIEAILNT